MGQKNYQRGVKRQDSGLSRGKEVEANRSWSQFQYGQSVPAEDEQGGLPVAAEGEMEGRPGASAGRCF